MKTKFVALSILIMLLMSPIGGIVYAQETPTDPPTDPEDPPVDPEDPPAEPEEPPTDPETPPPEEEGEGDDNLDPVIYEQIQQQAQERFQEMYELMFGGAPPEPEAPPTDPEDPPSGGADDENPAPAEEGGPTDPEDPPTDPEDPPTDPEDPPSGGADDENPAPAEEGGSTDPEGEELPEYDGPTIPGDVDPALANQFMSAWRAMQSAEVKENPRASANQYLRAMKQLRNAYKKYQKDNPEVVEDLDAPEEGVPEGDIPDEPTEGELDEVQQELVGRFQERFQERVEQMLQNYNDVEDTMSPADAVKAFSALTKAEAKLLRIQERIDAGDTEGAVDDLDDATDEMDEDFESMDDAASKQMFKTMNKLESRISKMQEQAARKAAKGEDTSDLDAALADARGNKDKTKSDFKEDKGNSGNSGRPEDKDTGKPDKDTGKPEKEDNPNKGGKKD